MAPFFSVVIDNHNYGRFLGAALESVLAQDFPAKEVEIVVVDDGSTDNSREIISRYSSRVRGVFQENQGQATAFNRGFGEAQGQVVCLLDSDDLWGKDKLSSIAPLFDDKAVGGVEHWLQDVDAELSPMPQRFPPWPPRYGLGDFLDGRAQFTATSALAFRRESLEVALPIPRDLFYYLDDFLSVRVLFDKEIANLPRVLGIHRVHGGNFCAGGYEDPKKLEIDFRMRRIFQGHLDLWLAQGRRSLTPRFQSLERLERWRREVLYHALRGEPGRAWEVWWQGPGTIHGTSFGLFRGATVFLAVLSPSLYLSLYSLYGRASDLRALRLRFFPE